MVAVAGEQCVFCEIVACRAEASRVYEDDRILAFMSIRPVRPGEFMVIPKTHIDHFCDISDDLATHIMLHAQRLARIVRQKLKPRRVGYVVHGFGVPHAHLSVVPLHEGTDIVSRQHVYLEEGRIRFGESHIAMASRSELDEIAALLRDLS